MRRIVWTVVILALMGGGGYGLWAMTVGNTPAPVPSTAEVARGDVRRTVLAAGVVEAASLVSVGAQVGGQIQSLPVVIGQTIAAGDLVAQIDPEDQQTDLLKAQAALAQIAAQIAAQQAGITEAELSLDRKRQLAAQRLTATQEVEAAEAALAVARANLQATEASRAQAELTVQGARVALDRTRITSPAAGTVVAVVAREGQTLNANQSSPTVIKVADLRTMVVKAEISEADVVNVRPGLPATITLSGAPDLRFRAQLRAVEPAPASIAESDEIDTSSAIYYNAVLDVPNADGILRIGMTAEVTIVLDEARDVLTVPTAALSRTREGHTVRVFTAATGEIETRKVDIGLSTAARTEIVSGLAEGDRVLSGGNATQSGAQRTTGGTQGSRRAGPPALF